MRRGAQRSIAAAVFALTSFGFAACGSSQSDSTARDRSPRVDLASMNPCDALSPQQRARFGAEGPGELERIAGARTCSWTTEEGFFTVGFYENKPLEEFDFPGGEPRGAKLAGRDARLVPGIAGTGGCEMAFKVDSDSTITVGSVAPGGDPDSTISECKLTGKLAPMVEAKLPDRR